MGTNLNRTLINESTLTDIADALREKTGTTSKICPANFASIIRGLNVSTITLEEKLAQCISNGNLDSLSWGEIQNLSANLENGTYSRDSYTSLIGLHKQTTYDGETCYAILVDILERPYVTFGEELTPLDTKHGLTFWLVKTNNPMEDSNKRVGIEVVTLRSELHTSVYSAGFNSTEWALSRNTNSQGWIPAYLEPKLEADLLDVIATYGHFYWQESCDGSSGSVKAASNKVIWVPDYKQITGAASYVENYGSQYYSSTHLQYFQDKGVYYNSTHTLKSEYGILTSTPVGCAYCSSEDPYNCWHSSFSGIRPDADDTDQYNNFEPLHDIEPHELTVCFCV